MAIPLPRRAISELQRLLVDGTALGLSDAELLERFAVDRDEQAFETILNRHGPMVLRVCLGELRDPNDVEDAFQATFMVLVRKAGSIRIKGSLAGWLFRVAHRIAVEANVQRTRRLKLQKPLDESFSEAQIHAPWREFASIHEEVSRLPEHYRSAIVLCDLEGKTHSEAGLELGVKPATMTTRVARARAILRKRLSGRGVLPTVAAGSLLVEGDAQASTLSSAVVATAVRNALQMLLGRDGDLDHARTKSSLELARRVLAQSVLSRVQVAVAACAIMALACTIGIGAVRNAGGVAQEGSKDIKVEKTTERHRAVSRTIVYSGKVLDSDGKPMPSAKLELGYRTWGYRDPPPALPVWTCDAQGIFRIELERSLVALIEVKSRTLGNAVFLQLLAFAKGYGPAWIEVKSSDFDAELEFELPKDDVPIVGKVIDLEGRPIAGAKVSVLSIVQPNRGLDDWIEKTKNGLSMLATVGREGIGHPSNRAASVVASDEAGAFTLWGIGSGRIAMLSIEAPRSSPELVMAMTRDDPMFKTLSYPRGPQSAIPLFASQVLLTAAPGDEAEGTVTDRDNGTPLEGASVFFSNGIVEPSNRVLTDERGHFRIGKLPRGGPLVFSTGIAIAVQAKSGEPYFLGQLEIKPSSTAKPYRAEVRLKSGVWIEGSVRDANTLAPVVARVDYYACKSTPGSGEVVGLNSLSRSNYFTGFSTSTRSDGSFKLLVLPGKGVVAIRAQAGKYRYQELNAESVRDLAIDRPLATSKPRFHQVRTVEVSNVSGNPKVDFALESINPVRAKLIGPDDNPVKESLILSEASGSLFTRIHGDEFELEPTGPGEKRAFAILHPERGLGAVYVSKGDEQDGKTIRLLPTGIIKGRLVDEEGVPSAGIEIHLSLSPDNSQSSEFNAYGFQIWTDEKGQFVGHDVIAEAKYSFFVPARVKQRKIVGRLHSGDRETWTIKPGETLDIGDVQAKRPGN